MIPWRQSSSPAGYLPQGFVGTENRRHISGAFDRTEARGYGIKYRIEWGAKGSDDK